MLFLSKCRCLGGLPHASRRVKFECAPGTVFSREHKICVHSYGHKCEIDEATAAPPQPRPPNLTPGRPIPPGPVGPSPPTLCSSYQVYDNANEDTDVKYLTPAQTRNVQ